MNMTIDEKTNLKWKFLLTRCEVRILVLSTSPERPQPLISVMACKPVRIGSVISKIPFY